MREVVFLGNLSFFKMRMPAIVTFGLQAMILALRSPTHRWLGDRCLGYWVSSPVRALFSIVQ